MLHNAEEKFSTKAQETLGFKKIKPKQNFTFVNYLIVPEKWLKGVTKLQL